VVEQQMECAISFRLFTPSPFEVARFYSVQPILRNSERKNLILANPLTLLRGKRDLRKQKGKLQYKDTSINWNVFKNII
jgi:hypothetical protein